ncbi:XIAP-associated factor 1 isoform X2 [Ambystoma mexicanum]|uniref:XIAP-associated factor 1 isoform X2 n=1 Tax=Ambystoma mexicanum TaxID=8296 RepID=UPI0037E9A46E
MEQETRFCGNCKKDVASANFSLHEVHCLRFLGVCQECGECVPHKDMKEHQDESHTKVKCELCHQRVQQCLLEEHKAEKCEERLITCKFCSLEVASCKFQEHDDSCGSRTELCPDCKKYIMLKDTHHKYSCLSPAAQQDTSTRKKDLQKKLRCPKCSTLLTESTFLGHQKKCKLTKVLGKVAMPPELV